MKATITDRASLDAISPLALRSYLLSQGWEQSDTYGNKGSWYSFERSRELLVPVDNNFADYAESILAAINVIAEVEDRSGISIYNDISLADMDIIRIRAPHAGDDGSINIDAGVSFFHHSREILLAAACASNRPQRAFRARRMKDATEYLSKVKMGQTERGSFILTFLSPVPPNLVHSEQMSFWPEIGDEPFTRQVTRTLYTSLQALKEAIEEVNKGGMIEAFESRVSEGVSANLCDATANLIAAGNGLDISLTWAATRPVPNKRLTVSFKSTDVEMLEEAAKELRNREPRPSEQVVGFVTALAREEDVSEGRVTLKALIDGKLNAIKVDFGPEIYSLAIQAHDHRCPISLEGDLEREGQRWKLMNPREVRLLTRDDD